MVAKLDFRNIEAHLTWYWDEQAHSSRSCAARIPYEGDGSKSPLSEDHSKPDEKAADVRESVTTSCHPLESNLAGGFFGAIDEVHSSPRPLSQ